MKKEIEKIREYDRNYQKKRRKNNEGLKTIEYRIYCKKYPEKVRAHRLVWKEIRNGRLIRGKCFKCSSDKNIHAHHEDYSKPLDIIWVCPIHHKEFHNKQHVKIFSRKKR